jgi:hypothetical protein
MIATLQDKKLQIITYYYFYTLNITLIATSQKAVTLGLATSWRAGYVRDYSLIFLDKALKMIRVKPDLTISEVSL